MAAVDVNLGDIGNLFTSIREAWTGEKIKDPVELAKIDLQLSQLEHLANQGQIKINQVEAAHKSLFVAGWRPFIGWVCGIAIAYAYLISPLLEWLVAIFDITRTIETVEGVELKEAIVVPTIDTDTLYQLVLAMLGMATLRTYEKKEKVNREK